MQDEILVVIPTIINHGKKYKLIDALHREPNVTTILVMDNGNCFGIPDKRKKQWDKVWHVRPGCNMNWLHSNNFGAAIAIERNIPYVCFLNDDVWLSNPFFKPMLESFRQHPDAGVVVPQYSSTFGDQASSNVKVQHFKSRDADTKVKWVDGTCMLIPQHTLQKVGLLDPHFKAPGWAADVDYSIRASKAGLGLYVSHRAMLWHHRKHGGHSAVRIYGNKARWLAQGLQQARTDLESKYGSEWPEDLPGLSELYPTQT